MFTRDNLWNAKNIPGIDFRPRAARRARYGVGTRRLIGDLGPERQSSVAPPPVHKSWHRCKYIRIIFIYSSGVPRSLTPQPSGRVRARKYRYENPSGVGPRESFTGAVIFILQVGFFFFFWGEEWEKISYKKRYAFFKRCPVAIFSVTPIT